MYLYNIYYTSVSNIDKKLPFFEKQLPWQPIQFTLLGDSKGKFTIKQLRGISFLNTEVGLCIYRSTIWNYMKERILDEFKYE